MSKTMKILVISLLIILLGAVGASAYGVISLPIGPIDGILATEEESSDDSSGPTENVPTPDNPTGSGDTPTTPPAAGSGDATALTTTSDGSNQGNSVEAAKAAVDISGVMSEATINSVTTVSLFPIAGGVDLKNIQQTNRYRQTVTTAIARIAFTDSSSDEQWKTADGPTRTKLVDGFLQRLQKRYKNAARSVVIIDSLGNVLAAGDAQKGQKGRVRQFPMKTAAGAAAAPATPTPASPATPEPATPNTGNTGGATPEDPQAAGTANGAAETPAPTV